MLILKNIRIKFARFSSSLNCSLETAWFKIPYALGYRHRIKILFLCFLFFPTPYVRATQRAEKTAEEKKVDSLCMMHNQYLRQDVTKAITISTRSLALADSIDYDLGRITSKNNLGNCYLTTGDFELSLKYSFDALNDLKIVLAENDFEERPKIYDARLSEIYSSIGSTYNYLEYYPLALKYYNKAAKILQEQANLKKLAMIYVNKSSIYRRNNEVEYAKNMLIKSLNTFKELNEIRFVGLCYGNISNIYISLEDYDSAKKYLDSAIGIHRKTKDYNSLANAFNNRAGILYNQKKYEVALSSLDSASRLLIDTKNKKYISNNNVFRGGIYLRLNRLELAEKTLLEEFQNSTNLLYNRNAEQVCETLVELYEKQKMPQKVLKYKSILLDLKTSKEEHQDKKVVLEEKYAKLFDEQADLFDFKEGLYKKTNGIILFIFAFLALQLLILIMLFSRKKSINLN